MTAMPAAPPTQNRVIDEHDVTVLLGDVREQLATLPDASVQCIVTSPPYYGLRDYGTDPVYWPATGYAPMAGLPEVFVPAMTTSLGLEPDPLAFVGHMVDVFREVRRVLADDGVLWLNLGDSYAAKARGSDKGWDKSRLDNPGAAQKRQAASMRKTGERHRGKSAGIGEKNRMMLPARVALALQADGWILRNDAVWNKSNAMPESVVDRLSSRHESLYLFSKSTSYWFDLDGIRETRSEATERRYQYEFKTNSNEASATNHLTDGGTMEKANALGRNPGDVWTLPTEPYPGAHFAVMPSELARRCIIAGAPERVCTTCGHKATRIVATEQVDTRPGGNGPRSVERRHQEFGTAGYTARTVAERTEMGWTDCGHNDWGRAVVLDPFAGAGTTLMVARSLGRDSVGCELQPSYVPLIADRIGPATLDFGGAL